MEIRTISVILEALRRQKLTPMSTRLFGNDDINQAITELTKRPAPPAIPEEVRAMLDLALEKIPAQYIRYDSEWEKYRAARHWLASAPVATDKACSACGKRGKIFGEVLDDKDERIKHPLCGKCCQMWDDVDTKDDVWSAICVRRNSGAYAVVYPPREVKP